MPLSAGTRFGRYEITGQLGAGGMGEVYRARDAQLGRDVAIKVLPEAFAADNDRRARFEREAQTVASLSHPNIVHVYDSGAEGGRLFVVMELLSGQTLREQLKSGALAPRRAIDVAVQIARGLAAAHEKGLVHRDLKPENVFVLPDGHVKVLDFGLARGFTPDASGITQTAAATDPGLVMGTVGYMAPEQVRGQAIDARTDLFTLGAVLYEMLSGHRAFQRETAAETMTAILKEDPPELAGTRTDISPALDRIIRHALEKNPVERFQTARDIAFALGALSGSGTAPQVSVEHGRGQWIKVAAMIAGAAALVTVGILAGGAFSSPAQKVEFITRTFDSGLVQSARFLPDGATILYTGRQPDGTQHLFELRQGQDAPKKIGPNDTMLLAVSKNSEYAVLTNSLPIGTSRSIGTLSRMKFGEEPRPVLEGVTAADWSPDGESFAVVRLVEGLERLEYPVGKELYKSTGYISDVRVSPDGRRVLFMDHQSITDDRGWVRIADEGGKITTVAGELGTEFGTAWTPDGRRLLFSGSDDGVFFYVWIADAPPPGGAKPHATKLLTVPGSMIILDVNADGSLLAASESRRYMVGAKLRGASIEQDMSWLDQSWAQSLSADGSTLFFSDGHGGAGYSAVIRRAGAESIRRLGPGAALGISPDGQQALAVDLVSNPQKLIAYPTGPGSPVTLPAGNITTYEPDKALSWFPDHQTFLFLAAEPNKPSRTYKQSVTGGPPSPVFDDDVRIALLSRDGRTAVGSKSDGKWRLLPVDGGVGSEIPGLSRSDLPVGWTEDGRALLVTRRTVPTRMERVELATGARKLVREIRAPNLDSFPVQIRDASADGEQFSYQGLRWERTLYIVKGVSLK